MSEVLLLCMPFSSVFLPSIGLSLLKACLARRGIAAKVRYFSIGFAERVGQAFYCGIATDDRPSSDELAGEWIFSSALHEDDAETGYVEEVLLKRAPATEGLLEPASPALVAAIRNARAEAGLFLDRCLAEVVAERPRIVGFTSVFQQHVASLALARRIKRALPETFVVFGGANCEGAMGAETVRRFPFVDAAVSGEAELVFPELVARVLGSGDLRGLEGVRTRDGVAAELASGVFRNAPTLPELDDLPYPDYRDYFEQFGASRFGRDWQPGIFFETSRGCWWGERSHCTFCGLNGQSMAYRSKSAGRALEELTQLAARHPGCDVQVTDNILDMRYFRDFLPALAERRLGVELYYETKANLKKEQVRVLRAAGIRTLQPGIESLSDSVLKLMRKGVSALQNIQLLKWCKELGITPYWNLLWGFPGEPAEEYARMAKLVPLLTHLHPPKGFGGIRLDRFSPNFFDADRLGFAAVSPLAPYRHVYRLPQEALENLACFFDFRYREPRDVRSYVRPLEKGLARWQRLAGKSDLFFAAVLDSLVVCDLRPAAVRPLSVLRGLDRTLYEACDAASDLRQIASRAGRDGLAPLSRDAVAERLEPMLEAGLLLRDGPRYLALAVPLGEYRPSPRVSESLVEAARALGRPGRGGVVVPARVLDARPARAEPRAAFGSSQGPRPRRATPRRRPPQGALSAACFSFDESGDLLIRSTRART